MKKIFFALATLAFMGAAAPAFACEGGKCTMEHTAKADKKTKKGKKAATKPENCSAASAAKSCCAKPAATKAEPAKEAKKAQ